jgi:DNA-binding CsgD family transcriptional regulator
MIRVFVTDEFLKECKQTDFWVGPELARRAHGNRSPILNTKEIGVVNARDGLNLGMWVCHVDYSSPSADNAKLASRVFMEAFALHHRGFNIKEAFVGSLDVPNATVALAAGASFWDAHAQRYEGHWDVSDEGLRRRVERHHLVGISREVAFARWGSWMSTLFVWSPPKAGFSPSEQRLMLAALDGRTDEELATELAVSPSTVKNTWRSIFARAGRRLPDILPNGTPFTEIDLGADTRRGKEKRARLLAYVRDHPEEVRPFSQIRIRRNHTI